MLWLLPEQVYLCFARRSHCKSTPPCPGVALSRPPRLLLRGKLVRTGYLRFAFRGVPRINSRTSVLASACANLSAGKEVSLGVGCVRCQPYVLFLFLASASFLSWGPNRAFVGLELRRVIGRE